MRFSANSKTCLLEEAGTSRMAGTTNGSPSYVRMSLVTSAARRDSSDRTRNPLKLACATAILHHSCTHEKRIRCAEYIALIGEQLILDAAPSYSGFNLYLGT